MTSFFRDAVAAVASYIPGRSRPDYEPILTEDGDAEPTQQPVAAEEEEEAPSTARKRAATIILTIAIICLTFLLIIAAAFV
jgi:hypothetical protein